MLVGSGTGKLEAGSGSEINHSGSIHNTGGFVLHRTPFELGMITNILTDKTFHSRQASTYKAVFRIHIH